LGKRGVDKLGVISGLDSTGKHKEVKVSTAGGLHVDSGYTNVVFHDAVTVAGNGASFEVGSYKTLTVEIYGTSTTRTVTFYGKGPSGTLIALMGIKVSDLSTGVSTTGTGEVWQFDVTGLEEVIMDLTAVSGGNVSVKGRAVA
jgi:hypothetical protein